MKCCITAFSMLISMKVTPADTANFRALFLVRSVVPKQGMETAQIPRRSRDRVSKARSAISNANAESNPPERAITTSRTPVNRRRWTSPAVWISIISSQRYFNAFTFSGTKGCRGIFRSNSIFVSSRLNKTVRYPFPPVSREMNPGLLARVPASKPVSISAKAILFSKGQDSAKIFPFSAIRQ
jgi:hypothetical protein